jgi:IS4 transposase
VERYRWARAYREGRLVAGRVELAVEADDLRIGLSLSERRRIVARFVERLDPELRDELAQLVRRRGAAGKRIAERLAPVEVVAEDRDGSERRFLCRLQPPQQRYGDLWEIEFDLRELERAP